MLAVAEKSPQNPTDNLKMTHSATRVTKHAAVSISGHLFTEPEANLVSWT